MLTIALALAIALVGGIVVVPAMKIKQMQNAKVLRRMEMSVRTRSQRRINTKEGILNHEI
jgi:hypothetical protein